MSFPLLYPLYLPLCLLFLTLSLFVGMSFFLLYPPYQPLWLLFITGDLFVGMSFPFLYPLHHPLWLLFFTAGLFLGMPFAPFKYPLYHPWRQKKERSMGFLEGKLVHSWFHAGFPRSLLCAGLCNVRVVIRKRPFSSSEGSCLAIPPGLYAHVKSMMLLWIRVCDYLMADDL